jgi:hypothetical protein
MNACLGSMIANRWDPAAGGAYCAWHKPQTTMKPKRPQVFSTDWFSKFAAACMLLGRCAQRKAPFSDTAIC